MLEIEKKIDQKMSSLEQILDGEQSPEMIRTAFEELVEALAKKLVFNLKEIDKKEDLSTAEATKLKEKESIEYQQTAVSLAHYVDNKMGDKS